MICKVVPVVQADDGSPGSSSRCFSDSASSSRACNASSKIDEAALEEDIVSTSSISSSACSTDEASLRESNSLMRRCFKVSAHLEDTRQYASIHVSRTFLFLELIACILMASYIALMLQATTWVGRAFVQLPLGLSSSFLNGFLIAKSSGMKRLAVVSLVFSVVLAAGGFVCTVIEQHALVSPVNGALFVMTLMVFLPFARNRRLGCVVSLWLALFPGSLVFLAMNFKAAQNLIPVELQGFLLVFVVMVWKAFALLCVTIAWRSLYRSEVPKELYFVLVAVTVQSAEALRLVCLLGVAFEDDHVIENWVAQGRRIAVYSFASISFELGSRSLCFAAVLGSTCGRVISVSPELDVILRCKFIFTYTPALVLLLRCLSALLQEKHGF
eukprot:TRINITY_DN54453_c0_g1_i1.p1 TRINITY_DN54453_c0_g1~~TRINITY_DN54453_c0_g1_i1.p1  ORF type:complete len:385 (-),score=37.92 TRINITY_DN54453_c0_g1_i1:533-1687(-)